MDRAQPRFGIQAFCSLDSFLQKRETNLANDGPKVQALQMERSVIDTLSGTARVYSLEYLEGNQVLKVEFGGHHTMPSGML